MKKQCKVVMLPTEKAENCITSYNDNSGLHYHQGYFTQEYLRSINKVSSHLYILSDDEIKGKGFRIDLERHSIGFIDDDNYYNKTPDRYKRIIATTNRDLKLPEVSGAFINAYIKASGKITDIQVEYNDYYVKGNYQNKCSKCNKLFSNTDKLGFICSSCGIVPKLKDNTIIIHQSKTYTRDDMIHAITYTYEQGTKRNGHANTLQEYLDKYM